MKMEWSFWCQWVLLTLIGFLLSLYWVEIDVKPYVGMIQGAIGGAIIGSAQAIVLRQRVEFALGWVLGSIFGWGLMGASHLGAVGWIAPKTMLLEARVISGVFFGIQVGAWLGVASCFVLRRDIKGAIALILASSFSWAIALPIGWSIGGILRLATHLFLSELVGLAMTWMIVATITGLVLIWLLQRSVTRSTKAII